MPDPTNPTADQAAGSVATAGQAGSVTSTASAAGVPSAGAPPQPEGLFIPYADIPAELRPLVGKDKNRLLHFAKGGHAFENEGWDRFAETARQSGVPDGYTAHVLWPTWAQTMTAGEAPEAGQAARGAAAAGQFGTDLPAQGGQAAQPGQPAGQQPPATPPFDPVAFEQQLMEKLTKAAEAKQRQAEEEADTNRRYDAQESGYLAAVNGVLKKTRAARTIQYNGVEIEADLAFDYGLRGQMEGLVRAHRRASIHPNDPARKERIWAPITPAEWKGVAEFLAPEIAGAALAASESVADTQASQNLPAAALGGGPGGNPPPNFNDMTPRQRMAAIAASRGI